MQPNRLQNLTLLYVEDDPLIRQNAVEYLMRLCNHVFQAQDGKEAWAIYQEQKPDIIISDIKMPKMNGLEMATKIRQEDKQTPIIIATAHTETDYLLQAVELQLIKYVVKPITSAKLQEALSMAYEALGDDKKSLVRLDATTYYERLNQTLVIGDEIINLTNNEQRLLELLTTHHQRVVRYEEIEQRIWQYEGMSMDALRSLVRAVRKKLQGDFIENISGSGYRLKRL